MSAERIPASKAHRNFHAMLRSVRKDGESYVITHSHDHDPVAMLVPYKSEDEDESWSAAAAAAADCGAADAVYAAKLQDEEVMPSEGQEDARKRTSEPIQESVAPAAVPPSKPKGGGRKKAKSKPVPSTAERDCLLAALAVGELADIAELWERRLAMTNSSKRPNPSRQCAQLRKIQSGIERGRTTTEARQIIILAGEGGWAGIQWRYLDDAVQRGDVKPPMVRDVAAEPGPAPPPTIESAAWGAVLALLKERCSPISSGGEYDLEDFKTYFVPLRPISEGNGKVVLLAPGAALANVIGSTYRDALRSACGEVGCTVGLVTMEDLSAAAEEEDF